MLQMPRFGTGATSMSNITRPATVQNCRANRNGAARIKAASTLPRRMTNPAIPGNNDSMLTDYITRGGQAVVDDMNVSFTSGMPDFGMVLTDSEITAILDYIKSTWPDRIRATQAQRSPDAWVD